MARPFGVLQGARVRREDGAGWRQIDEERLVAIGPSMCLEQSSQPFELSGIHENIGVR